MAGGGIRHTWDMRGKLYFQIKKVSSCQDEFTVYCLEMSRTPDFGDFQFLRSSHSLNVCCKTDLLFIRSQHQTGSVLSWMASSVSSSLSSSSSHHSIPVHQHWSDDISEDNVVAVHSYPIQGGHKIETRSMSSNHLIIRRCSSFTSHSRG